MASSLPTSGHSLEVLEAVGDAVCFGGLRAAPAAPLEPIVGRIRPNTAPAKVRPNTAGGARARPNPGSPVPLRARLASGALRALERTLNLPHVENRLDAVATSEHTE